ncbi:sigma-70 family RNA polymerase sigma factor [Paenibacillus donghaensis]|uniref:RNA polymerase sigma factor n=1 Tax=Paenibacillus TaxID=44249 RepID=UPI001883BD11|nr:sigma-70 family RNA polymerase sigma factor [Paenibacillus donghaensis]MBE9914222.1 sigma-70 family RNA polymerase sigma factor [Paenibacillus donghaensis]
MDSQQEADLIRRIIDHDKQLFSALVDRYKHKVYGVIRGMGADHQDAQDLAQETFIRMYRFLPRYQEGSSLSAWVYTIAVNVTKDFLRKRRPIPVDVVEGMEETDKGITPEQSVLEKEMKRDIYRHLKCLPENYRLVLLLKYTNELSYEEIVKITGFSMGQVRNALHRGKRRLKKELENKGELAYEIFF